MVCSYDGKYLFTAGGCDAIVHMWEINIKYVFFAGFFFDVSVT
jgi:hypothetical protein